MLIEIKTSNNFDKKLTQLRERYGEEFEILNGFHSSQMNFSEFIDSFVRKNVADVTIDANANASNKDIRSLLSEKGKSEDKLFGFNKLYSEIEKKYGTETADEWLKEEYVGTYYMHDAYSVSYMPYCFTGDTEIVTDKGIQKLNKLVNKDIVVLNKAHQWEHATVKHFGRAEIRKLILKRRDVEKVIKVTGNHRWFVINPDSEEYNILQTDELTKGMFIPYNSVVKSKNLENWEVIAVEDTKTKDDVYCAVVEGTQSFTLEGNVLTHNCYAYDLGRLAKEGLFFLSSYNHEPPKHLTTFLDDVIEFISFMSNRSSGAVGIPNIVPWIYWFWRRDCENGYAIKDDEYYLKQMFQKLIYRLNQPFMRIDQSA